MKTLTRSQLAGLTIAVIVLCLIAFWPREPRPGPEQRGYDLFRSPVPTPGLFRAFLPAVYNGSLQPWTSPKKGIRRHLAPCSVDFGAAWEYVGPGDAPCSNLDSVLYLGHPVQIPAQLKKPQPANHLVMLYNELDTDLFGAGLTLDGIVTSAADLLAAWPDTEIVGLCNAHEADLTLQFIDRYTALTGSPPPLRAFCVHCYNTAEACVDKTQRAIDAADGLPVWVTEYNLPLGRYRTVHDVIMHNACFTLWMENEPSVERYSMWSGYFEYGTWVPADRVTGWQPLAYPYSVGGKTVWDYTEIGRSYAYDWATWEDCAAGGYLRSDQIPVAGTGLGK